MTNLTPEELAECRKAHAEWSLPNSPQIDVMQWMFAAGLALGRKQAAAKPDEDGWIAYLDTHPLPVDGWTIVDIKLRDGTVRMKQIAGQLSWPWGKTGRDIIAYRIHKEIRKDAERYRWLRDVGQDTAEVFFATDKNASGWGAWDSHEDKDAAIDAAIRAEKGE